jgi:putative 2OG-Fe(II) oxygenase
MEYIKSGCVKLPHLLNSKIIEVLEKESKILLKGELQTCQTALNILEQNEWQDVLFTNHQGIVIRHNFLGQSPQLDQAIEFVITIPVIEKILEESLGSNYKLWLIQIRQASPLSGCLRMHQDRPGQTTLQILLDDVPSFMGSTVILPGSNIWPRVINSFPFVRPKYILPYLKALTGKKGDIWLFSPTMWHGRYESDKRSQTVLMISFVPFDSPEKVRTPPQEITEKLGPKLSNVLQKEQWTEPFKPAASIDLQKLLEANPQFELWSPWQLIIIIANAFSIVLSSWRFCKKKLTQMKQLICGRYNSDSVSEYNRSGRF